MLKTGWIATLVALFFMHLAHAQSRDALIEKYTPLAGSEANAKTLVSGLREGKQFTLDGTTFNPPTGKLGNGEVNIALSLADAKLRDQGITSPTSAQLNAALIGDAAHPGILALRADGQGWGQIAQTMGIKLGDVMRAEQARHQRPEQVAKHEKPERPERPERPEKPERHGR